MTEKTTIPTSKVELDFIKSTNPSNADVLRIVDSLPSFRDSFVQLQSDFPSMEWSSCSMKVLRNKIFRMKSNIKQLKRNKKANEIQIILDHDFEFPKSKHGDIEFDDEIQQEKFHQMLDKTKVVVLENRSLKRQLQDTEETVEDISRQVKHYERKTDILLQLLSITTQKHNAVIKSRDKKQLEKDCKQWEQKYENLSNTLDKTTENLQKFKSKLHQLNVRNSNKKLKRREEKIEKQNQVISEKESELKENRREIENLRKENEKKDNEMRDLKKMKRNLLVKVCRLSKRREQSERDFVGENDEEIGRLKADIREKEMRISELEEINKLLDQEEIMSFYNGKFTNEIRETIMALVTQCGVSLKKVNVVMQTVVQNLTGKSLSRLPSTGVLSRLLVEAKRIAQVQVAEAMLQSEQDDSELYYGNCLHQDGTSKFHRHFQSFQVTTSDKRTYSLGLREVGSGDAATLMQTFKEEMSSLSDALQGDETTVANLVSSIVATMSDQGSTNPVFNRQLEELKENLLPSVIENWDGLSDGKKAELSKISSFFCKMHIFVNMAGEVDRCLSAFENTVAEGKNPFSFEWSESGGSRLTRTVSKAFTMHGCDKSGVGSHFSTFLEEKGKKNKLVTFRGHRFNHLFCVAGATYHHAEDIKEFLNSWSDPNDLLKSVNFDIREVAYLSSIRALGIIDKLITGPFWKVIESVANVIALNPCLELLRDKLEFFSKDSSALLSGEMVFSDITITKDEVYESLFAEVADPVLDTYTQMALELATGGMLLILERQAKDQLPGGKFYEPSVSDQMRAAAVPTTNTCSERDFAQLDILMRLKPSASTECYESIIMWTNNKTSDWLCNLHPHEREKVLNDARSAVPEMKEKIKQKKTELYNKKLRLLRSKQEKKAAQENKQYTQKIKLTTKLNEIGGLWLEPNDMEQFKVGRSNDKLKEAIIVQLQFRKQVLNSKGPREKFQQQVKGRIYNLSELESNIKEIIEINKDQEQQNSDQHTLTYKSMEEVSLNLDNAKSKLAKKLQENRQKIKVSQQQTLLPAFIKNPSSLIGKNIKHKFKLPETREIEWFTGVVTSLHKENGRKSKYFVKYDGEEEESCFALLIDIENGDIIIA